MFTAAKKPWIKRLGLAAVAAVAIGAVTLPSAPAEAQVVVGVGVPYYYAPGYYRPYYYPRRVGYRACGWGWHWTLPHLNGWGHWVSGGCRPNW
jgi:hypothetical protein